MMYARLYLKFEIYNFFFFLDRSLGEHENQQLELQHTHTHTYFRSNMLSKMIL